MSMVFLLVFYSNFVSIMHRFWDIQLQKCSDLENRVRDRQGHWKCHHFRDRRWFQLKIAKFPTLLAWYQNYPSAQNWHLGKIKEKLRQKCKYVESSCIRIWHLHRSTDEQSFVQQCILYSTDSNC